MSVSPLLWYAAVCLGPAGAFLALERVARAWTGQSPMRPRSGIAQAARTGVVRAPRPLEQLVQDLGRLRAELDRLRRSRRYARHHHMTVVALAYDDVLRDCARALDIPFSTAPLSDVDRLRLEVELEAAGLSW